MFKSHETHKRTIVKTLTYRALGFIFLFTVSYTISGDNAKIGLTVALMDFLFKFAVYYGNERIWSHIRWGVDEPKYDFFYMVVRHMKEESRSNNGQRIEGGKENEAE